MFSLILSFMTIGIGDVAEYTKQRHCTSRGIRSIYSSIRIAEDQGDDYLLDIYYKVKSNIGSKSSSGNKVLSKYYFTRAFLDDLERDGVHDGDGFSLRHDGFNNDGCHLIHIYNLKNGVTADSVVCHGLPVLGIMSLKTRGKIYGSSYKACLLIK